MQPLEGAGARSIMRSNRLTVRNYPSGHMVYLDNASRTQMKEDLAPFYASAVVAPKAALAKELVSKDTEVLSLTP